MVLSLNCPTNLPPVGGEAFGNGFKKIVLLIM